jgi:hypothetical protein
MIESGIVNTRHETAPLGFKFGAVERFVDTTTRAPIQRMMYMGAPVEAIAVIEERAPTLKLYHTGSQQLKVFAEIGTINNDEPGSQQSDQTGKPGLATSASAGNLASAGAATTGVPRAAAAKGESSQLEVSPIINHACLLADRGLIAVSQSNGLIALWSSPFLVMYAQAQAEENGSPASMPMLQSKPNKTSITGSRRGGMAESGLGPDGTPVFNVAGRIRVGAPASQLAAGGGVLFTTSALDSVISVWHPSTCDLLARFRVHTDLVTDMLAVARHGVLVTASMDRTVWVYNLRNWAAEEADADGDGRSRPSPAVDMYAGTSMTHGGASAAMLAGSSPPSGSGTARGAATKDQKGKRYPGSTAASSVLAGGMKSATALLEPDTQRSRGGGGGGGGGGDRSVSVPLTARTPSDGIGGGGGGLSPPRLDGAGSPAFGLPHQHGGLPLPGIAEQSTAMGLITPETILTPARAGYRVLAKMTGHTQGVRQVIYVHSADLLLTAGFDLDALGFDLGTNKQVLRMRGHRVPLVGIQEVLSTSAYAAAASSSTSAATALGDNASELATTTVSGRSTAPLGAAGTRAGERVRRRSGSDRSRALTLDMASICKLWDLSPSFTGLAVCLVTLDLNVLSAPPAPGALTSSVTDTATAGGLRKSLSQASVKKQPAQQSDPSPEGSAAVLEKAGEKSPGSGSKTSRKLGASASATTIGSTGKSGVGRVAALRGSMLASRANSSSGGSPIVKSHGPSLKAMARSGAAAAAAAAAAVDVVGTGTGPRAFAVSLAPSQGHLLVGGIRIAMYEPVRVSAYDTSGGDDGTGKPGRHLALSAALYNIETRTFTVAADRTVGDF